MRASLRSLDLRLALNSSRGIAPSRSFATRRGSPPRSAFSASIMSARAAFDWLRAASPGAEGDASPRGWPLIVKSAPPARSRRAAWYSPLNAAHQSGVQFARSTASTVARRTSSAAMTRVRPSAAAQCSAHQPSASLESTSAPASSSFSARFKLCFTCGRVHQCPQYCDAMAHLLAFVAAVRSLDVRACARRGYVSGDMHATLAPRRRRSGRARLSEPGGAATARPRPS